MNLEFDVKVKMFQTIEILTNETPEQFLAKLRAGEYATTLSTNQPHIYDVSSFENVGNIIRGDLEHLPQDIDKNSMKSFIQNN